jgi:hypothetical protein
MVIHSTTTADQYFKVKGNEQPNNVLADHKTTKGQKTTTAINAMLKPIADKNIIALCLQLRDIVE